MPAVYGRDGRYRIEFDAYAEAMVGSLPDEQQRLIRGYADRTYKEGSDLEVSDWFRATHDKVDYYPGLPPIIEQLVGSDLGVAEQYGFPFSPASERELAEAALGVAEAWAPDLDGQPRKLVAPLMGLIGLHATIVPQPQIPVEAGRANLDTALTGLKEQILVPAYNAYVAYVGNRQW
jgi:hypothetical protein